MWDKAVDRVLDVIMLVMTAGMALSIVVPMLFFAALGVRFMVWGH